MAKLLCTERLQDITLDSPLSKEKKRASFYVPQDFESVDDRHSTEDKRLALLNDILELSGKSAITRVLTVPWQNASEKTKSYYVEQIREVMESITSIICPFESESIWMEIKKLICIDSQDSLISSELLQILTETYKESADKETRRQLLSILADKYKFEDLKTLLPNLTAYEFSMARLHHLKYGKGMRESNESNSPRERVAPEKLDHFLDFTTSSHIIQDLPFGMKKIKLSSGEVLDIPNVIRVLAPTHLVQQYHEYCQETEFQDPLKRSTLMNVLSEACLASIRKSLQGLDYYVADGGKAFDDLQEIVDRLVDVDAVTTSEAENIKTRLKNGKQYIKTEFKVI